MKPEENWAEIDALLQEALDVPVEERARWLEERCAGNTRLRDRALALLEVEDRSRTFLETPVLEADPEQVGDYRIVRRLAIGASSIVYEAEKAGAEEAVALKIVRGGIFVDDLRLRQFQREERALARLRHPGIARILEVGRTERGQQFIAMELVRGRSLDEYVRRERLPLQDRLRLFVPVCDAVEHAHRRGVIHRDLKPCNIVVDGEGRPRLLDFGLARLTGLVSGSTLARPGEVLGTVPYLSPEQAGGRSATVDDRTDIYALGVILYQLATDELPFDLVGLQQDEALRLICSRRPVPPRQREPGVPRELEKIVLQAMRMDPDRRYASARALGEDVTRFLNGEPVQAVGPEPVERLLDVVREHRVASAGLAAVLVGLLVFLVTTFAKNADLRLTNKSLVLAKEAASDEAQRAAQERARAQAVLRVLESTVLSMASEVDAGEITMGAVLDRIEQSIEGEFPGHPLDEAEVRAALGRSNIALGRYQKAALNLRSYVDLLRAHAAPGRRLVEGHRGLGDALANLGRYTEAVQEYELGLALLRSLPGGETALEAALDAALGRTLAEVGRGEEARAHAESALAAAAEEAETPAGLELSAESAWSIGQLDEAEAFLRRSLELRLGTGEEDAALGRCLAHLGQLLAETGRLLDAREPIEQALELLVERLGDEHPETIASRQNLATLLVQLGEFERARSELLAVLESWRALELTHHEDYASTLSTLGVVCIHDGDTAAGAGHLRDALEAYRACDSARDDTLANHSSNLARVLTMLGELEEAEGLVEEAVALRRGFFGTPHPAVARSIGQVAELKLLREDLEGAEKCFRESVEMLRETVPPEDLDLADGTNSLAAVLHARGRTDEARSLYEESLAVCRSGLGEGHQSTLQRMHNLGDLLVESKEPQEAEPLLRGALDVRRAVGGDFPPTIAALALSLGRCLQDLGDREEEAAALFQEVLALDGGGCPEADEARQLLAAGGCGGADDSPDQD